MNTTPVHRYAGQDDTVHPLCADRRDQEPLRGTARAAGWDPRESMSQRALSPAGENCEWHLKSQVWKAQRLPASGTAPNLGNIPAVCPLSVVCTNLPNKMETKPLRVSAPLLKEQRGLHTPDARITPDHRHPELTRDGQGSPKGDLRRHTPQEGPGVEENVNIKQ